jgi:hypothetical protein
MVVIVHFLIFFNCMVSPWIRRYELAISTQLECEETTVELPDGIPAVYFNLSGVVGNNRWVIVKIPIVCPKWAFHCLYQFVLTSFLIELRIVDVTHDDKASFVRTMTVSKKQKIVTITFHKSVPRETAVISIIAKIEGIFVETIFNLTASTKKVSKQVGYLSV